MKTRKQQRAEARISHRKQLKKDNATYFMQGLVRRKFTSDYNFGFCCYPHSFGMPLEELLSHGTELCGGSGYFFPAGKLRELLPDWHCERSRWAHLIIREQLESIYNEDGRRR